jgi:hypothetical protein
VTPLVPLGGTQQAQAGSRESPPQAWRLPLSLTDGNPREALAQANRAARHIGGQDDYRGVSIRQVPANVST